MPMPVLIGKHLLYIVSDRCILDHMLRRRHRSHSQRTPLSNGFHLGEAPRRPEGLLWPSDMYGGVTLTALAKAERHRTCRRRLGRRNLLTVAT